MRIKTKEFKAAAKTILYAIDKEKTLFSETLELKANGNILYLNVTNRAYFVSVKFNLGTNETFRAAVNAQLFLSLISKLTTEDIELTCDNNYVKISANGEYKLPMIYNNGSLLELPVIDTGTVTGNMTINSNILLGINLFNSKELLRGVAVRPVQKYYYVDELGAITFTSGACVNSFSLESQIKMLLDEKVVRLFKLFGADEPVAFSIGHSELSDTVTQTKVKFETPTVVITAILPDSSLISSVPVVAIRGMANKDYAYSVVIEREHLLEAINRILLFNESNTYGHFEFSKSAVIVYDYSKENREVINLVNDCNNLTTYSLTTNLAGFKLILDGVEDEYVTIGFGDQKAIVVRKNSVVDIIPEIRNV